MPPFRLSAIATFCVCCCIVAAALLLRERSTYARRSDAMHAPPQASPVTSGMHLSSIRESSALDRGSVILGSPSSAALGSQNPIVEP